MCPSFCTRVAGQIKIYCHSLRDLSFVILLSSTYFCPILFFYIMNFFFTRANSIALFANDSFIIFKRSGITWDRVDWRCCSGGCTFYELMTKGCFDEFDFKWLHFLENFFKKKFKTEICGMVIGICQNVVLHTSLKEKVTWLI